MRQFMTGVALGGILAGLGATPATAGTRPNWEWLVVADGPDGAAERKALVEALRLLPHLPARIVVIDANDARPELKQTLLRLDAFVVKGSDVVYVVRQSALLRGAVEAQPFHICALASVVWHEIAHADGADEREARRLEQRLWTTFVRDQRIDQVTALRYSNALAMRPDAHVMASR